MRASDEPPAGRWSRLERIASAGALAGLLATAGVGAAVLVDPGTLRALAPVLPVVAGVGLVAILYAYRLGLRRTW